MTNFSEVPAKNTFWYIVLVSDGQKEISDREIRQVAHLSLHILNLNQKVEFHAEHDCHLSLD